MLAPLVGSLGSCSSVSGFKIDTGGGSSTLTNCAKILQEISQLARQIGLFSAEGPSHFKPPVDGLPLADTAALHELWVQWAKAESIKRSVLHPIKTISS